MIFRKYACCIICCNKIRSERNIKTICAKCFYNFKENGVFLTSDRIDGLRNSLKDFLYENGSSKFKILLSKIHYKKGIDSELDNYITSIINDFLRSKFIVSNIDKDVLFELYLTSMLKGEREVMLDERIFKEVKENDDLNLWKSETKFFNKNGEEVKSLTCCLLLDESDTTVPFPDLFLQCASQILRESIEFCKEKHKNKINKLLNYLHKIKFEILEE